MLRSSNKLRGITMLLCFLSIYACKKEEVVPSIPPAVEQYLVSTEEAIEQAKAFAQDQHPTDDFELVDAYTLKDNNEFPAIHVVNYKNDATDNFVLFAADLRFPHHLAYGSGPFLKENIVEGLSVWVYAQMNEIAYVRAQNYDISELGRAFLKGATYGVFEEPATFSHVCDNKNYIVWTYPAADVFGEKEGLLHTKWGQGCIYNRALPNCDNPNACGKHVTGCVATAMAQVMRFHQHPRPTTLYGTSFFEWDLMPSSNSATSNEQVFAVSKLMWLCGNLVDMDYDCTSSGAQTCDVVDALQDLGYHVNDCSDNLESALAEIVDFRRPVIFRGKNEAGGGHAWVGDGVQLRHICKTYRCEDLSLGFLYPECSSGESTYIKIEHERFYVHMNWGWDGYANGYFTISSFRNDEFGSAFSYKCGAEIIKDIFPYN